MSPTDTCYTPDDDNDGSATRWERLIDEADYRRTERKDREWEAAMDEAERKRKEQEP